ncbi:MAG TPA: 50S ribosomal protein L18 [Planctomycetes bacterium]|nr:50S ribosomal protein L18 [Planctomycetota bacterium]
MKAKQIKNRQSLRRKRHVRRTLRRQGPTVRLTVVRSLKHISAQVIDESAGVTVCGVSSTAKRFAGDLEGKSKTEKAAFVGKEIAKIATEKGIERVAFDRGSSKYHGRVKALAEAAREGGLKF